MAQGRVKIGVGFDVDKSGLNELKSSLVNLQNATKLDVFNVSTTKKELAEIQHSANQVAAALNKSYNAKLGTYNIEAFKKEINATTGGLSALQQQWSKVATGERAFRNLANSLTSTNLELKETHSLLDSMGTTLMNTIKWSIASTAVNTVTGSIEKAWSFTKKLDESLTNIMIVTEKSSDQMAAFARQANTAAKALGASTKAYSDAALIYYQQGLGDDEVISRTNTTLKAANVTGQNAAQVSEQLTAVWNGYKVAAQETELYVDKLSAVAATTAADLEELSTGMSKVASAASTMGVDIDQLNAQLATVISVTRQAPESVGTAFKTIFARMGDIEAGLDTETTLGEYTSQMEAMGFNVLDANNQLRDQGEVIEEIGAKWKSMSREQQIALAQTMAGTRQYNNLLALFDNWGMYEKALQTSANAAGTLSQQNEEYLDSLEAKMQQLTTTAEELYLSLFDSDSFKDGIDLLTKGVDVLGQFVESVGGGGTVLLSLGAIMTRVFSKQISQSIATTATNFINAKQNAEALAITMQNIKDLDTLDMDEATKSILNMKERLVSLRQAGLLTNEQFEDLTRQIKDFSDAADEASIIKERAQQLDNTLRFNPEVISRTQKEAAAPKGIVKNYSLQKVIEESEKQFAETGSPNAQGNTAFHGLERQLDVLVDKATVFKTVLNEASSTKLEDSDIIKFQNALAGDDGWFALSQSQLVSEDTVAKIKAISKEMAALSTELKTLAPEDEKRAEVQAEYIRMLKQELTPLWRKAEQEATKTAEEIRKTGEEIANGALHASDVTVKGIQDTFKKIDLTQAIQKVVNFTSSLGAAASALNILGNLDDIWSNEDLSAGEKMTQTIMNVTSAAGMLLPLIQGITAWRAKSAAAIVAETTATGANVATQKLATKAAQDKAFWSTVLDKIEDELDENQKERIRKLIEENKELDENTRKILINAAAKKKLNDVEGVDFEQVKKENDPSLKDIFENKGVKVKQNFGEGAKGFKETWSSMKGTKGLSTVGAAKTGAASAGGGTAASVGAGIAAALPYAIAVAAVVAAIATSWSIASKKNQEEQKAWEKAAKAAESARDRLNEVNQEWDNLESSLSAIQSQEETIANLTEGTVEWKKALADVNNEVISLMSKYPELAKYVTRDASTGQLSISEAGQQAVQEKQLAELTSVQGAAALANLAEAQARQDKLLNDFVDQNADADLANAVVGAGGAALVGAVIGSIGGPIGIAIGAAIGGTVGIIGAAVGTAVEDANEENRKALIANSDTYKAAMEAYITHGDKVYDSEESLSKALEGVENVDHDLIKSLVENSEETRALAEAYNQAKAQEYDQKVALGASIVGADASEGAKYIAGDTASIISEDFKKAIENELKGGNDKDEALAKEWLRLTGVTEPTTIDTKGKNKVVVKNASGETLGDYDAEDLLDIVTQLRWQEDLAAKGGEEALAAWQEVSSFVRDTEIENALAQILGGAAGASFESLTKEEFEKLNKLPTDKLKQALSGYAEKTGQSVESLFKLFTDNADAAGKKWQSLLDEMPDNIASIFEQLITGLNLTATEAAGFANIVSALSNQFGAANAQSFLNLFSGLDEADKESLIGSLSGVTWAGMSEEAIADKVKSIIESSDIEIGLAAQDDIVQALNLIAGNGFSVEKQQEAYKNLRSLIKDVADDGKISADVYDTLTDKQKEYFTVLADGTAILTKSSAELLAALREDQIQKWSTTLAGAFQAVHDAGTELEENEGERLKKIAEYQRDAATPPVSRSEYNAALNNSDWDLSFLNTTETGIYQSLLEKGKTPLEAAETIFNARQGTYTKDYKEKWTAALTGLRNAKIVEEYDVWARELDVEGGIEGINETYAEIAKGLQRKRDDANEQLKEILEQIYQETGGGATFTAILDQLKAESPELATLINNFMRQDEGYSFVISDTRREAIASTTDNSTYANWIRDGVDTARIGTIEAENIAYENQQRILQKLQDEFNDLTGAEKLQNLAEQAEVGVKSLAHLENGLLSIKNSGLQVLEQEIDKVDQIFGNISYETDKEGNYTDPIRALLSKIGFEAASGNMSKDTLAAITQMQMDSSLGLDEFQIQWLDIIKTKYETYFTEIEAQEDKIDAQKRANHENELQRFEESLSQIQEYYDTQIGYLETSISLLDHQVELNKLINGENSVSADQLEGIAAARERIYEQRVNELKDWTEKYSQLAADDMSAEANEIRNQYYQAAQDAAQAEIDMIQAYTDANTAAVTQSIEEILGTSLSALAKLKEEADWTATMGDRYLSERDKAFGLDTLKYTYGQAARETVDLKVREEINSLLDQELEALEAKDALTQADLDRANQQLEILKARIALERAEQDMSNMRLVRGANGEYSYQFVANPAARAEAEQRYREEVEEGRRMNEEALSASANNTYEAITSLTDYLKEATEGGINEQEGRRIEALVGEIGRAASRIKGDLDAVGTDLGIDTTQKDWWLDEANQALLRTEGVTPEWIDALMKGEYNELDADALTQMSEGQLNDLFSKVLGDEWQKVIDAANEDAKNAAENMVDPEYLKGQIDRVVEALGLLSQGKEVPEQLWTDANNTTSGVSKAATVSEYKPVITGIDGTRIESVIRNGVATTVSNFEGVNNRVHLTPVDAGNGVIEQKVEIVANFPDATDRDEIKAAFDDLIGLAVQYANQNVKGK